MRTLQTLTIILIASIFFVTTPVSAEICEGFGPQAPRDITQAMGTNPSIFSFAPTPSKLNLCDIHFHKNAEHKGPGFAKSGGKGDHGGWKCNESDKLSKTEMATPKTKGCTNVTSGDTVEVHWVFSSCDVKPGHGLGTCLSDTCPNPQLRVESQVFVLVNDDAAADFTKFDYANNSSGYHQPASLPDAKNAVSFLGSTTGPSFDEQTCSPLQVSWNVRPTCSKLNINTLNNWCTDNSFAENKAHGVRQIVTDNRLLSSLK